MQSPNETGDKHQTTGDASGDVTHSGVRLAPIPDEAWARLVKNPFCRRHPVLVGIFWIVVVLTAFGLGAASSLDEEDEGMPSRPSLALVTVKGPIMDVSGTLSWVEKIGREENIRGVVLRVDSPGGGAAASQELYSALKTLAEKKPLVVSMGSTAASGGLMIAMAGERIFANASTITGSIGVRMDIPQMQKLMETIGIGKETLTTAPYKDAGSPMRPPSADERAYLEGLIEEMHREFVGIIAEGRKMSLEEAGALADGRALTGRTALEKGLVDEIGGMDRAVAWLAEKTGVDKDRKLVKRPEQRSWLARQISLLLSDAIGGAVDYVNAGGMESPVFLYR